MASTLGTYNPFRYRSYVYDQETGLYYLQSRYYSPKLCRFVSADNQISPVSAIDTNLFTYCGNNPMLVSYNNYSNVVENASISTRVLFQDTSTNATPDSSHSPFELLIGVLTSENADLPSWMSINAFYVQGAFLQGLSLASFSIGVLDATFHTPKWFSSLPDDHLANPNIYLGVGTWNANLSLGLGASGTAEILSGSIGVRFGDAIDVGVKGYIGIGFTLDFSEGIKFGAGFGLGFEASIKIDWYRLFS